MFFVVPRFGWSLRVPITLETWKTAFKCLKSSGGKATGEADRTVSVERVRQPYLLDRALVVNVAAAIVAVSIY
jgi:hypothetical protein